MKKSLFVIFLVIRTVLVYGQTDTLNKRPADSLSQRPGDSLAQKPVDSIKQYHIAIFTPLYLDSAFDRSFSYQYGKQFPKFFNPGLEFYEGIQFAIDSLRLEGARLHIYVFDTKAANPKFESVLVSEEIKKMDMLFGHVTVNEAALLARVAAVLDIPFINVNLPNDANVTNNPNYIILNSTLYTHCEGIYRFLQRNFALSNITFFRRKGRQDDVLNNIFNQISKTTASVPLKIKVVSLDNGFTAEDLRSHLDEDQTNVCVAGSLDVGFARQLLRNLAELSEKYTSTVIGMPTIDGMELERPEFKGIKVYYSTPFYINPDDRLVESLTRRFKERYYSRPTDMVFRGYEAFYHFGHLLMIHDKNLGSSLSDKKYLVFNEFDIQPVLDKQTMTLNYFENRKLYFIKKEDGVIKGVY